MIWQVTGTAGAAQDLHDLAWLRRVRDAAGNLIRIRELR